MADDDRLDRTLAVVLAGAMLARILIAGLSEPWTDELFFAVTARGVPAELVTYSKGLLAGEEPTALLSSTPRLAKEAHPPLTLLLAALIPHDAPLLLLRLPSLLFGAATLLLATLWVRRRLGPRSAVVAALVLGAALPLAYHATEVRPYAAAIFFGLATTLLAAGPRWPSRWPAWRYYLYGAAAAAGLYSHYYVGALYPAHLVVVLAAWRQPGGKRHALGTCSALAIAVILFLPWLPVPLAKAREFAGSAAALDAPGARELVAAWGQLAGLAGSQSGSGVAGIFAGATALGLAGFGTWRWRRHQVGALAVTPIMASVFVLFAPHVHALQSKHMAAAAAPLGVLIAAGMTPPAAGWRALARSVSILLLGLLVATQLVMQWRAVSMPREPWAESWRQASLALRPGDLLIFRPAHAKLAFQRQATLAGQPLYPADNRLRAREDWQLPPLANVDLADDSLACYWLFAASELRDDARALQISLFGPHALLAPEPPPVELLRGLEGDVLLEIGPIAR